MYQIGDYFGLDTPILDVDVSAPGTAAVTRTLTVALGRKVNAHVNAYVTKGSVNGQYVYLSSLDAVDGAPSITVSPLATYGVNVDASGDGAHFSGFVWTNTAGQIRSRISSSTGSVLRIVTLGWEDLCGKDA